MKAAALLPSVSMEEYLRTAYRPDCDYVDGKVLERNVGEHDHGDLQSEFVHYLRLRRKQWKLHAVIEQRVQVSATHFRVPDVCVVASAASHPAIYREPPFICIEVLSPEDRQSRIQQKIDGYLKFGVPNVWVIDPETRRVWVYTTDGSREVKDGMLRTENPAIEVNLAEVFGGLES